MNAAERQERMHALDEGIRVCVKCPLHESRTHAVPGEGPVPSDVFFIGEGPGAKEDRLGRPFVGPSGMLLVKLLEVAGLVRQDVFITSCVKCRPPNNRTPRTIELDTCQTNWLNSQLDLVDPKIVVLLGKVAIGQVLHEEGNIARMHGRIVQRDHRQYLLTYHPAAAFRVPQTRVSMEEDMIRLKELLA
ncbi:MAG: uracil-DNA glycosylase [Solirubrobacterales bacterium]